MIFSGRTIFLFLAIALAGCSGPVVNPSFNVSTEQADQVLAALEKSPQPLDRPVVVIAGLNDPGLGPMFVDRKISAITRDRRVIDVNPIFCTTFDQCRQLIIETVQKEFPSDDPARTTEVDVIGISMGGLAARYAAAPPAEPGGRRLAIKRLFTISSPFRGAARADWPTLSQMQRDMRIDSPFMKAINAQPMEYEVIPYVRLGDGVVGAANAAPAGQTPLWLENLFFHDAHMTASSDPRILADIALRLRGLKPFATEPRAPLPAP